MITEKLLYFESPLQNKEAVILECKINYPEFDIQSRYPKRYYTINETADITDLSVRSVYNKTKKGQLKASKFGRRIFYERHELIKSIITYNL